MKGMHDAETIQNYNIIVPCNLVQRTYRPTIYVASIYETACMHVHGHVIVVPCVHAAYIEIKRVIYSYCILSNLVSEYTWGPSKLLLSISSTC